MILYDRAKTEAKVNSELSEKLESKVEMHHGSMLSHFFHAVVVDVVNEITREGVLSEFLYADDLVQMSETIEGLKNKPLKWNKTFESKGM